jgi:hypothetical protein
VVAADAATLTILGPGRRPEVEFRDFPELDEGELDEGGELVEEDFVPPGPRASVAAVVSPLDVGDFPPGVVTGVCVEVGGEVVRGVVPVESSVVVGLADEVVVVAGGPGLFARTELGGNGGWTFGLLAPNVHASTLPGGGS